MIKKSPTNWKTDLLTNNSLIWYNTNAVNKKRRESNIESEMERKRWQQFGYLINW
jgi:hypothetical protein